MAEPVTRCTIDWEQHKLDVTARVTESHGAKYAAQFIEHYASRYDQYRRNFLAWKLALVLKDEYHFVRRNSTAIYACVGPGGSGKTTLMKNVLYWFWPEFSNDRLVWDNYNFVKVLRHTQKFEAVHVDEPDDTFAPISREGKLLRAVLGRMRQKNVFIGICATDMNDIPPYIWRKVRGVFYTPFKGKGMLFIDRPEDQSFPISAIRNEYKDKFYRVFFEHSHDAGAFSFDTGPHTHIPPELEEQYVVDKADEFDRTMDEFLASGITGKSGGKASQMNFLVNEGWNQEKVAKFMGVTQQMVSITLKKAGFSAHNAVQTNKIKDNSFPMPGDDGMVRQDG